MSHSRRLLHRRGRVYYFRQRVPQALVAIVGRASLRTADPHEARRRAAVVELGLGRRWAVLLARRECAMRLEDREVERLAEEYFERLVAEDRAGRHAWRPQGRSTAGIPDWVDPDEVEFGDHVFFGYWEQLRDEEERMLRGDRRSVKEGVEQVAAGRAFDEDTRDRLAFAMQRARMRYLRDMAKEWEDDFAGKPRAATVGAASAHQASANTGESPNAKRISEAVPEWVHEEGREWNKKTQDETRRALGWFVQVVGDVRLDTVKREDVKRFKANLERVPRGTAAAVDIRAYAGAELPPAGQRLDRATVTKALGRVAAFFAWAVHPQHWIERSPAAGALRKGKKRGRDGCGTPS